MGRLDVGGTCEVGDRARHPQDPVQRASRQLQAVHRALEQGGVAWCEPAMRIGLRLAHPCIGLFATGQLQVAGVHHPFAHRGARFAGRAVGAQCAGRQPRHLHVQVDAFEQRPGDASAIAADHLVVAQAAAGRVAGPAAGAGIHRRHQLEARRELAVARGPRDADAAGFQRLAQHFQRVPAPFRQLVEEQHAVMGQRDLAGSRIRPAADDISQRR